MASIPERLREALELRQMRPSELVARAEKLGDKYGTHIGRSSVTHYTKGQYLPSPAKIQLMADVLNVNPTWLMGEDVPMERVEKHAPVRIPVLGTVRAGIPLTAVEEVLDWEEITQEMAEQGDFFALRVKGDSMAPRICEGDVLIVRKQDCAETGDIVVALVNGEDATVKKYLRSGTGIILQALNPDYAPLIYSRAEVLALPVRIIGKVVENRQKF